MFKPVLVLAGVASAAAFAPHALPAMRGVTHRRPAISNMQMQQKSTADKTFFSPETFSRLDADRSGKIDQQELMAYFADPDEAQAFLKRGDVNGDGEIDYAEFERLININLNGEEAGGNLEVRSAMQRGLLKKSSVLADCVMVGNKGFDPLNLATSLQKLNEYRDSELKHGRLAMLAAVGWPTSELLHSYLAKSSALPDLLAAGGRAPSVLNGGLREGFNPILLVGALMLATTVELYAVKFNYPLKNEPGDVGFDPLGVAAKKSPQAKRDLELKELNNGRLAMIAILGMVAQEVATHAPVVKSFM
eukprot:3938862-Rhodomonas_salina.1